MLHTFTGTYPREFKKDLKPVPTGRRQKIIFLTRKEVQTFFKFKIKTSREFVFQSTYSSGSTGAAHCSWKKIFFFLAYFWCPRRRTFLYSWRYTRTCFPLLVLELRFFGVDVGFPLAVQVQAIYCTPIFGAPGVIHVPFYSWRRDICFPLLGLELRFFGVDGWMVAGSPLSLQPAGLWRTTSWPQLARRRPRSSRSSTPKLLKTSPSS